MEYNTHNTTKRQLERIGHITHIHEAAVKSDKIDEMLNMFYKKVYAVAKLTGIQLSTLLIADYTEDQYNESPKTPTHKAP